MSESLIRSLLDKKRAICSDIKWANSQPCQRAHIWKFAPLHSPPLPILYLHVSATIQLWKDFWVAQWFNQILSNCLTNTVHAVRGFHGKNLKLKQKKKMKKYFFKGFVSKLINTLFGRSVHLFMNFFPALVLKTIVAQMLF